MKTITVGSLFAGVGGIDLGLEMASTENVQFKTVWQVENDPYATRVLERHWPAVRRWRDVRTFPPDAASLRLSGADESESGGDRTATPKGRGSDGQPKKQHGQFSEGPSIWDADLICGGFPCQDISYAGKGAGLDGERSGLWYEFARIVRILGPRYVVVENVSALLTRGIDAVLGTLASLGYDARWDCIPAAAVGAPHIRDRVFVIAFAQRELPGLCSIGTGRPSRDLSKGGSGTCKTGELATETADPDPQGFGSRGWPTEPAIRFVDDGLPPGLVRYAGRTTIGVAHRGDKLRCLGNAVVPQVAQYIGRMIAQHETNQ